MKTIKQLLNEEVRPKIRLSEVERLIRRHRIIIPPLSRKTLQNMCEEGAFETAGSGPGQVGWLVYEDSFMKWIDSLDSGNQDIPEKKGIASRDQRRF